MSYDADQPYIKLRSGIFMPQLGFGTAELTGEEGRRSIEEALEVGYRHIDTADFYGNHREIGAAIQASELSREDIFVTSKVWHDSLRKQEVIDAGHRFQEELQSEYIDLLLVHWPNSEVPIQETLEGFAALRDEGVISAMGVSNFTVPHLQKALQAEAPIECNQVEFHPTFRQNELHEFCRKNGIAVTAYAPLGHGDDLDVLEVKEIAEKHGASSAQVIVSWLLHCGILAIPKARDPKYIEENFQARHVELDKEDMQKMAGIERRDNRMYNPDIAEFEQAVLKPCPGGQDTTFDC